jgi:hypothetical protein
MDDGVATCAWYEECSDFWNLRMRITLFVANLKK